MKLPVYVIHLERARERGQALKQNWAACGIAYRLISAVDRRDIEAGKHPGLEGKAICTGDVALNASMIKALDTYQLEYPEDDHPGCLIFEDDAIPIVTNEEAFFERIKEALAEYPLDILLLHQPQKWDERIRYGKHGTYVSVMDGSPYGCVGFFISRTAIPFYRKLLSEFEKNADNFWPFWTKLGKLGLIREPLVLHPPDETPQSNTYRNTGTTKRTYVS